MENLKQLAASWIKKWKIGRIMGSCITPIKWGCDARCKMLKRNLYMFWYVWCDPNLSVWGSIYKSDKLKSISPLVTLGG